MDRFAAIHGVIENDENQEGYEDQSDCHLSTAFAIDKGTGDAKRRLVFGLDLA